MSYANYFNTSNTLAGPGNSSLSPSFQSPSLYSKVPAEHHALIPGHTLYASPRSAPSPPSLPKKLSGGRAKRIRITPVKGFKSDNTPTTTYDVRSVESDSDSGSENEPAHEQGHGNFVNESGDMQVPGAPRIPFPPSLAVGYANISPTTNVGLGIDFGGYTPSMHAGCIADSEKDQEPSAFGSRVFSPLLHTIEPRYTGARTDIGLGITIDGMPLGMEGNSVIWEDSPVESDDDEEAIYHLPSGLLSPELVMSTDEFKDSLRKWMERRTRRRSESTVTRSVRPRVNSDTQDREIDISAPSPQSRHRQSI